MPGDPTAWERSLYLRAYPHITSQVKDYMAAIGLADGNGNPKWNQWDTVWLEALISDFTISDSTLILSGAAAQQDLWDQIRDDGRINTAGVSPEAEDFLADRGWGSLLTGPDSWSQKTCVAKGLVLLSKRFTNPRRLESVWHKWATDDEDQIFDHYVEPGSKKLRTAFEKTNSRDIDVALKVCPQLADRVADSLCDAVMAGVPALTAGGANKRLQISRKSGTDSSS